MQHLALVGDSILDNRPYTTPEPDTSELLQRELGAAWTVTLLARDGATMADVPRQATQLQDGTHVAVLSVGGNDAREHLWLLGDSGLMGNDMLARLVAIGDSFASAYRHVLAEWRPRVDRLIACTIYEPPLSDARTAHLARVPLGVLNDRIVREAARVRADVLDLRTVCTDHSDFVMKIEPSPAGAQKIARAIASVIQDSAPRSGSSLFAV